MQPGDTDASPLTQHLLDPSLIDYTLSVTRDALRPSEHTRPDSEHVAKTARLALEFFTDILDPTIEAEKLQRDIFLSCVSALQNPSLAPQVPATHPSPTKAPTTGSTPQILKLTAAQRVLDIPDTLNLIISHIPSPPKSRRETLRSVALTSRSFHIASDLLLWSRPRDLDTIWRQVHFAFGVSVSEGLGENLGKHVKRLRIRWMKGGWNAKLVQKIATLCPGIQDFTIHWGDSTDSPDPVAPTSASTLCSVLSSLQNLRHLSLYKFSSTADIETEFTYPLDAHVPFSKLASLALYGFTWYWPNIAKGLGRNLKSLEIGLGTILTDEQLSALPLSVPSLITLRLGCNVRLHHIQSFVSHAPGLECVEITQFSEQDEDFVAGIFLALTQLRSIKEVSCNVPIGLPQITTLASSPTALQSITIKLREGVSIADYENALIDLVTSKWRTLMTIDVSFEDSFLLAPSDAFVTALSKCPNLQRIDVEFTPNGSALSSSSVDALLKSCSMLKATPSLETLVEGNVLYQNEYKFKLDAARESEQMEWEENILGN